MSLRPLFNGVPKNLIFLALLAIFQHCWTLPFFPTFTKVLISNNHSTLSRRTPARFFKNLENFEFFRMDFVPF
jgi:hypothetical protein